MRFWALVLAIGMVLLIKFPHRATAHFPATDGPMEGVLHVDPDDSPSVGQPAVLNFILSSDSGYFSLKNCICVLSVGEQGQSLVVTTLSAPTGASLSVYDASVPFVFPKRDVYQIELTGKPLEGSSFPSFELNWNFRVDQTASGSDDVAIGSTLKLFLGLLIGFLLVGGLCYAALPRAKNAP